MPKKSSKSNAALVQPVELDNIWARLLRATGIELDALARRTGALHRVREIEDGESLMKLLLVYVSADFSLRDTALWARTQHLVCLSDEALRKRFHRCVEFLGTLIGMLVGRSTLGRSWLKPGVRIHDGTVLCGPGARGSEWRLHVCYDAENNMPVSVALTTERTGESARFAQLRPGDVFLGDRLYGLACNIHEVIERGGHPLVRAYLPNVKLEADVSLEDRELMRRADQGDVETSVRVPLKGRPSVNARLIILPLPPAQAAEARRKQKKRSTKKGSTKKRSTKRGSTKSRKTRGRASSAPAQRARKWAGYLCLLTTVPAELASPKDLATWYRLRWQIELYFKRCRSILGLGHLHKANDALAKVQILGKVLVAVVTSSAIPAQMLDASAWRSTRMAYTVLLLEVFSLPKPSNDNTADVATLATALAERQRKRKPARLNLHALSKHIEQHFPLNSKGIAA